MLDSGDVLWLWCVVVSRVVVLGMFWGGNALLWYSWNVLMLFLELFVVIL